MDLQIPENCPTELKDILQMLKETKSKLYHHIVGLLQRGECNYLSNDMYGYPYDYQLYVKDSLDPQVNILNSLLEKVKSTFQELLPPIQE